MHNLMTIQMEALSYNPYMVHYQTQFELPRANLGSGAIYKRQS
jgi:hypothetical protein